MPLAAYSPDNPAAVDPWPIEQTLAPIALGGDQMQAQGMLDSYRLQRQAASNLYGEDLAQQHQFAYTQLAQQMAEARLKEFPNIAKLPGGAQFIAQGGIPGMDMGGNSDALTNLALAGNRAQAATDFEHAGAGLASTTAAGFQPSTQQASVATGGFSGPQGDPTAIGVAKLKLQGDLARAAASGGAGSDGTSVQLPPDPNAPGTTATAHPRRGESYQQFITRLKGEGRIPGGVSPPDTGNLPPGGNRVPGLAPKQGQGAAPAAGGGTPVANASPGADPMQRAAKDYAETVLRVKDPAAYADVMARAAKNGGNIQLVKDSSGRVIGAQGEKQVYR